MAGMVRRRGSRIPDGDLFNVDARRCSSASAIVPGNDLMQTTTKHLPAPFSAYHNQDVWYSQLTNTSAVMNCAFEQGEREGTVCVNEKRRERGGCETQESVGGSYLLIFHFHLMPACSKMVALCKLHLVTGGRGQASSEGEGSSNASRTTAIQTTCPASSLFPFPGIKDGWSAWEWKQKDEGHKCISMWGHKQDRACARTRTPFHVCSHGKVCPEHANDFHYANACKSDPTIWESRLGKKIYTEILNERDR